MVPNILDKGYSNIVAKQLQCDEHCVGSQGFICDMISVLWSCQIIRKPEM